MITKRDFILRGSCFCEKCSSIATIITRFPSGPLSAYNQEMHSPMTGKSHLKEKGDL